MTKGKLDQKAFDEWKKQFPDATEAEVEHVKAMYTVGGDETDQEVVSRQNAPQLDPKK